MMTTQKLDDLYEIATENGITIYEDCPESIVAMAAKYPSGKRIVSLLNFDALDTREYYSSKKERFYTKLEVLAHEMGHCMTDSFYYATDSYTERCKQEARAEKWSYEYVIPFSELCDAVKKGNVELWSLSEYFRVSENFVQGAINHYAQHNKVVPQELYKEDL